MGDLVWAKDEATSAVALKRIAQTFERVAPSTLALTFSNGETIETTVEHPFYVQDRGFVPAGLVALGNSIVTRAGPSLEVTAIEKHSSARKVYNFEVADFHTYFVGQSALWVHNAQYSNEHYGKIISESDEVWTKHKKKDYIPNNITTREQLKQLVEGIFSSARGTSFEKNVARRGDPIKEVFFKPDSNSDFDDLTDDAMGWIVVHDPKNTYKPATCYRNNFGYFKTVR